MTDPTDGCTFCIDAGADFDYCPSKPSMWLPGGCHEELNRQAGEIATADTRLAKAVMGAGRAEQAEQQLDELAKERDEAKGKWTEVCDLLAKAVIERDEARKAPPECEICGHDLSPDAGPCRWCELRASRDELAGALRGMIAVTELPGTRMHIEADTERAKAIARVALASLDEKEADDC